MDLERLRNQGKNLLDRLTSTLSPADGSRGALRRRARSVSGVWIVVLALIAPPITPERAQAIAGLEGTFEYAFDAPWRIEPARNDDGELEYGMVPIQISIHDADMANDDPELWNVEDLAGDGWATAIDALFFVLDPLGLVDGLTGLFGSDRTLDLPGPASLGRFCSATVTANPIVGPRLRRTFDFDDLTEVEVTRGPWLWNDYGDSSPPPHQVCRPDEGQACPQLQTIAGSSEWHALAWMALPSDAQPGSQVPIEIDVRLTRRASDDCEPREAPPYVDVEAADFIHLVNHVRVDLGREALPRFSPSWLYGDLHYHAQGTDNEGESGYNYRGVVRAMGAMGLDFAFATDHASSSEQLVDADFSTVPGLTGETWGVLRDMDDARFRFLHDQINGPTGVNRVAAFEAGGGRSPQTRLSNGTYPQLFLGGEIDIVPEVAANEVHYGNPDRPTIAYGNGLRFDVMKLCTPEIQGQGAADCEVDEILLDAGRGELVFADMQGMDEYGFARQHLVYLPRRADDEDAFVASESGEFGGGGRRLTDSFDSKPPVAPEIAGHGYAFVAHPLSGGGNHSLGPGSVPFFDSLLEKAFGSRAILGLQLWNENTRRKRSIDWDEDFGYQRPENAAGAFSDAHVPVDNTRLGFYVGEFELEGWRFHYGARPHDSGLKHGLAHGAYTWDRMNLWGLDPARTESIPWLSAGEPRKVFMAGGSDAHGDFNYRREGYFTANDGLTDTALGTPRNLVFAGPLLPGLDAPAGSTGTLQDDHGAGEDSGTNAGSSLATTFLGATSSLSTWLSPSSTPSWGDTNGTLTSSTSTTLATTATSGELAPEAHDSDTSVMPLAHAQRDIVDALADGHFSVTDGPALRIVIDRNGNGEIDSGDTPMGGVVDLYGDRTLPLLVEWKSTEDFGAVDQVHVYVGAQGPSGSRIYGPSGHGPRTGSVPNSSAQERFFSAGFEYERGGDDYWRITDVPLFRITGTQSYVCTEEQLPPPPCNDRFECDFAEPETHTVCENRIVGTFSGVEAIDLNLALFQSARNEVGQRFFVRAFAVTAEPHERFAFTNPVWALQRDFDSCPTNAGRAIDSDGDGLPDGCDPCPLTPAGGYQTCVAETTTGTIQADTTEPEEPPAADPGISIFTRVISSPFTFFRR